MNMKEAYLKVLGLDQKPLEEKKLSRPSWVPESIADEQVSDFMGALASAHKEGCDTFKFGDKSYKMTVNKPTNEAKEIDFDDPKKGSDGEDDEDDDIVVKGKGKKEVEEELKGDQHKIDKNKNGKIDAHDFKLLRKEEAELEEETDDEHYAKQSPKMQDAINLHLRKGKSYKDAVTAAKVHVKEEAPNPYAIGMAQAMKSTGDTPPLEKSTITKAHKIAKAIAKEDTKYAELTATLSEGGFTPEEIQSVISKLEEKAEPQDMGDNLSDGELDFIETHEVEIVDGTPEKPDFDKDIAAADAPSANGAGTVEIDGKKAAEDDAENPVKSQATAPAGKGAGKVEVDGAKAAEEVAKKVG